jgi:mRNA interferase RelE/StbE
MKIHYSDKFAENAEKLPKDIKKILKGKLEIMFENPRHPSLRTKKIQGQANIFESSITIGIRMTWQYTEDGILLRNIGEHDKTLKDA